MSVSAFTTYNARFSRSFSYASEIKIILGMIYNSCKVMTIKILIKSFWVYFCLDLAFYSSSSFLYFFLEIYRDSSTSFPHFTFLFFFSFFPIFCLFSPFPFCSFFFFYVFFSFSPFFLLCSPLTLSSSHSFFFLFLLLVLSSSCSLLLSIPASMAIVKEYYGLQNHQIETTSSNS